MSLENSIKILDYKILNISSMEQYNQSNIIPLQKFPKLLRLNGTPWTSERFCHYPQKIIIKFPYLVNLFQINILSNSKKISRKLQFYYYFPDDFEKDINYKDNEIPFKKIGFVNLRDNKQCNYSVREYKKIFIKIRCLYLKIELENNYPNNFNKFQQVGLSSIEFFGRYLGKHLNLLTNNIDEDDVIFSNVERILKEVCPEAYDNLNKFVNNKKNLDYADYEEIKGRLDEIMKDAKKIYQIELLEKEASKDNDFDKAIEYKNKKEKAKYILKSKGDEINKLYKNEFNTNDFNLEKENMINGKNGNKYENENSLRNSDQFKEDDLNSNNNNNNNNNNNKKMKKSYSAPEINSEKEKNKNLYNNNKNYNNNNEINPVEEIDPRYLNSFSTLASFLDQDGLRNLLSSKMGNKLEGFKLINSKLDEIFSESNENMLDSVYELIELIGLILEDKNTLFLKPVSDLIEKLIDKISNNENMMNDNKLKNLINKNIMSKIKETIGEGSELKKLEKFDKATELFLYILDKNIFNLDTLIKSLLIDDINTLNSNNNSYSNNNLQNNKIYSKLNIIKKILEDFDNKVNNNMTSRESFPKDLIAEYILLNTKNKDIKIRNLIDELFKIYIELFGLDDLKENALLHFDQESDYKKLSNLFPALKPLFNQFLKNTEEVNLFIPSQKPKKEKKPLMQNSFQINFIKNNSPSKKEKSKEKDKYKEGICQLCKFDLGSKSMEEHINECKMYTKCEGCGEHIKVEKLNNHKLNFCKNKKKFKQCNKCKEAISSDLYNLHVDKNVCNPIKLNMSRCPFCHHDIEKDQDGFYQHLIIDGCAYQT